MTPPQDEPTVIAPVVDLDDERAKLRAGAWMVALAGLVLSAMQLGCAITRGKWWRVALLMLVVVGLGVALVLHLRPE